MAVLANCEEITGLIRNIRTRSRVHPLGHAAMCANHSVLSHNNPLLNRRPGEVRLAHTCLAWKISDGTKHDRSGDARQDPLSPSYRVIERKRATAGCHGRGSHSQSSVARAPQIRSGRSRRGRHGSLARRTERTFLVERNTAWTKGLFPNRAPIANERPCLAAR